MPTIIDETVNCPVIVLVGPTAIGKTELSFELVERFDCEIISLDSVQVYRYMNIGSAKPSREELLSVNHHLINIVDPDEKYDAARFVTDCMSAIRKIESRGRTVLLTGGTGLYLQALLQGLFEAPPTDKSIRQELEARLAREGRGVLHQELCRVDPEAGKRIHRNDTHRLLRGLEIFLSSGRTWSEQIEQQRQKAQKRIFTKIKQVGLNCSRDALYKRIAERSAVMVKRGLVEEVKDLQAMGFDPSLQPMQSIGYRHANAYIAGTWDKATMMNNLVRDTRRYAKRQLTWFKKKRDLCWFDRKDKGKIIADVARELF